MKKDSIVNEIQQEKIINEVKNYKNVKIFDYENSFHNPCLIKDSESFIVNELSKVNNSKINKERRKLLNKIDFNKACIVDKNRIITLLL